jgi:tetratricopeptide (TPR) repeat protein
MTRSEFITYLENPSALNSNKELIFQLQEILQQFPYFQSAQLLLTKAFHETENLNFESQLKKAAAYASDRRKLHTLLFSQPIENIDTNNYKESTPTKHSTAEIETTTPEEEEEVETKVESESIKDELEQQILSNAIHSSFLQDVSDELPEEFIEESNTTAPTSTEITAQEPVIDFNQTQEHSFSEWLNFYSEPEEGTSKPTSTTQSLQEPLTSATVLKQEFYSASKMARLSVQEDDDLVTETLAKIYADQGNLEKAIKAYQKLQLKYPEKRVYFAGRIEKIRDQLNT